MRDYIRANVEISGVTRPPTPPTAKPTAVPTPEQEVDLHFVALVHVDGGLYELDGRKDAPVRHGDTAPESFLVDAGAVVKKFVEQGGDSLSFNAIAMGANGGDAMF